jgi:phosphoglycerate dehydrogenase-like enzyme
MAFDMRVVGIRRDPRADAGHVDAVHADLRDYCRRLICPRTAVTARLVDAGASPHAAVHLIINTARTRALRGSVRRRPVRANAVRGAALDATVEDLAPFDHLELDAPALEGGSVFRFEQDIALRLRRR